MNSWVKVDIEMPTDGKLYRRPIVERYLWTCLLCLAKKLKIETGDSTIYNETAESLARRYNLGPTRLVQDGLDYFAIAKPKPMLKVADDGAIVLLNFERRQGTDERDKWRDLKRRQRDKSKGTDGTNGGPVPGHSVDTSRNVHHTDEDEDEDLKNDQRAASAAARPSISDLESDWPKELLSRVKEAVTSTRKSGIMAEGPWFAFLLSARNFAIPIRIQASEHYLERACASEGKGERYLLGIMRGENGQNGRQAPAPAGNGTRVVPGAEATRRMLAEQDAEWEQAKREGQDRMSPETKAKLDQLTRGIGKA